jgi:hypothetical protein
MFRKPTIADIYLSEVRAGLDKLQVPVFSPDTPAVRVGTIARFIEGAFDRRGHLEEVVGGRNLWADLVPIAPPTSPASSVFVSRGRVDLSPCGTVNVAGKDLLKARLAFTKSRAVVASFTGVVERTVRSPRDFDDLLWRLYLGGDLKPDEVVVWGVRRARSGTVLINRKGGVNVELSVDPALVSGAISFQGLALGVTFGAGSQASYQVTGPDLMVATKVKGLSPSGGEIETRYGFGRLEGARLEDYLGSNVPEITTASILADADFSQDED